MKHKTITFLLALCGAVPVSAAAEPTGFWTGDINASSTIGGTAVGDKANAATAGITVADVAQMIAILNGQRVAHPAADLNDDGLVNKTDLLMLIDIIMGNRQSEWRELKGSIDVGGGLGNGGGAGTTPPPADSNRR